MRTSDPRTAQPAYMTSSACLDAPASPGAVAARCRRVLAALACVAVSVLVPAAPASAGAGHLNDYGRDGMVWGNLEEYPSLAAAGPVNVRRAERLLRASRAHAPTLASAGLARRAGYRYMHGRPLFRPGFNHMRKRGSRFWGRFLDPRAPEGIVVWCPTRGACKTAAFMFRAPPGRAPSSWGKLLQWHRHAKRPGVTWMTHLWLVPRVKRAYATCAPMPHLVRSLGIVAEAYRPDVRADAPCKGRPSGHGHDGHGHHHDHEHPAG
jgi:hypothetical protein